MSTEYVRVPKHIWERLTGPTGRRGGPLYPDESALLGVIEAEESEHNDASPRWYRLRDDIAAAVVSGAIRPLVPERTSIELLTEVEGMES